MKLKLSFAAIMFLFSFALEAASLNKKAELRAAGMKQSRTQYEIDVEIDPKTLSYKGHQKVIFSHRQSTPPSYLLFFVYPNDPSITKSEKDYLKVSNVTVNSVSAKTEQSGPFLKVLLGSPVAARRPVTVEFDFHAQLPAQRPSPDLFTEALDELLRMFQGQSQGQTDYGLFSSTKDIINLGLWYPTLSKYDAEGWDEEKYSGIGDVSYFDPADFVVTITTDPAYRVVTSGTIVKTVPQKEGLMRHHVQAGMARDFEIELSARYQEATRFQNGTFLRSFFLPEHRESGEIVLETGVKAFDYFEKIFGPYPYTELDLVEAPLFGGAGGVEFPGLVTISSMLYKDQSAESQNDFLRRLLNNNPALDQLLEFVVAHEVAHQWWNAVVGSNSKKHPFIDEAMANYSAVLYFEHYYGRPTAEQMMALQMKVNYQLHRMMGGADKPVLQPVSAFAGAMEYAAIVYGKGALYFDHLRALMGDGAFFAALKNYYDTYWFRIAEPDDFTSIAKKHARSKSAEIDVLFQRWMKEAHGDEDIGPGTFDSVLKTIMAGSPEAQNPELQDLLQQLNQLLKQ